MTPAASWSPADYFRASRGARAAWERTDQQLSILSDCPALALLGLESGEVKRAATLPPSLGSAAAASPVSSPSSPADRAACDHPPLGTAGSTHPKEGR